MPRKVPRFHSLKKIKVRQDWSKWTLYNLSRLRQPDLSNRTYFQQKWTAKSDSRAYHGEHIREKKWKRQFKRFLPAVVPMDHKYLARFDGAEQAAGRGSGVDTPDQKRAPQMTPYMQMTYWPMERRLDTAIFRALFASSVRQARQFCVHGLVKVNGKKMIYPGYQLNPGDMFQVDPESVLFATGAPKTRTSRARHTARTKAEERGKAREAALSSPAEAPSTPASQVATLEPPSPHKVYQSIRGLMKDVKQALTEDVRAKDKQKLREFGRTVRRTLSVWKNASPAAIADLDSQFEFLKTQLSSYKDKSYTVSPVANPTQPQTFSGPQLSEKEEEQLAKAFERLRTESDYMEEYGKHDPEKPYATPWRPRNYMSAFAFIPRYLEVNQNICAAVYLRHPVARPGLAEVPTPFPVETGQLAFNWYLRRR